MVDDFVELCRTIVAYLLQYNLFIINLVEYVECVEFICHPKKTLFTLADKKRGHHSRRPHQQ